jgi:hypothetical protein
LPTQIFLIIPDDVDGSFSAADLFNSSGVVGNFKLYADFASKLADKWHKNSLRGGVGGGYLSHAHP